MAATPSMMVELGLEAPDFRLPDVTTGTPVSLRDFSGQKALLVMFICRHCPYVVHVKPELIRLARDYRDRGVAIISIDPRRDFRLSMQPSSGVCGGFPGCLQETSPLKKVFLPGKPHRAVREFNTIR